jgi:hypothetical protein
VSIVDRSFVVMFYRVPLRFGDSNVSDPYDFCGVLDSSPDFVLAVRPDVFPGLDIASEAGDCSDSDGAS